MVASLTVANKLVVSTNCNTLFTDAFIWSKSAASSIQPTSRILICPFYLVSNLTLLTVTVRSKKLDLCPHSVDASVSSVHTAHTMNSTELLVSNGHPVCKLNTTQTLCLCNTNTYCIHNMFKYNKSSKLNTQKNKHENDANFFSLLRDNIPRSHTVNH